MTTDFGVGAHEEAWRFTDRRTISTWIMDHGSQFSNEAFISNVKETGVDFRSSAWDERLSRCSSSACGACTNATTSNLTPPKTEIRVRPASPRTCVSASRSVHRARSTMPCPARSTMSHAPTSESPEPATNKMSISLRCPMAVQIMRSNSGICSPQIGRAHV